MYNDLTLMSALSPNFAVLRLCGHWYLEDGSKIQNFAYKLYSVIFIGFWFFISIISEIINILLSLGDLEKLTDASFLFLTHMAQLFKIFYFLGNDRRIKNLSRDLNGNIFKPKNSTQYAVIKKCIKETRLVYYVFLSMSLSTCLLWGIFPLIDHSEIIQLPLSAFYPFATDNTPIFEIVYVYQILATAINATCNVSMDTTASGFMVLVCGQLDLLNNTLENIRDFCTVNKAKLESDDLIDEELQIEMDRLLDDWVKHHKSLLKVTKEIGDLFNISVLSQFAAGCVIICLTMFELTLVPLFSVKFISMILYQGCMLVEIIIYCWYGNEIILKILRSSWSYFAVLYTVHQD